MLGLAIAILISGCDDPPGDGASGRIGISDVLGREAGGIPVRTFAKADTVVPFEFPRDHGPHPAFRSEWWYLTVVLETASERTFGVQFTLFRQGLKRCDGAQCAGWRSAQVYLGHVGLSDVEKGSHREWERISRGHARLAGVSTAPFEAYIDDWRLTADAAFEALSLEVAVPEGTIDLELSVARPITLQGDRGLSHKGADNASYYYSIPRLAASGRIEVDGVRHDVTGLGWLDREWSTSVLAPEFVGWDWFALHLDDGRDVMAFQLRRGDGAASEFNAGSMISPMGASETLLARELVFDPGASWRGWPTAWRVRVRDEVWEVVAAFPDQVMATSIAYWEGVVYVLDGDGRRIGSGYLEMTGYTP